MPRQTIMEALDIARIQAKPFAVVLGTLLVVYVVSSTVDPGWATYVCSLPAALVVALTSLARVNDMGPELMQGRHHIRRAGLIFSGTGAVMVLMWPASDMAFPISWRIVVLLWGIACVWLTTPNMPPWEDYITGRYRDPGYSHAANFSRMKRFQRKG